jgi:hypothetical protein
MISEYAALIPKFPQRQDSTLDQLRDLAWVANRIGMHDAGDHLRRHIEMLERPIDWGKVGARP